MTLKELYDLGTGSVVKRENEPVLAVQLVRYTKPNRDDPIVLKWYVIPIAHTAIHAAMHGQPATLTLEDAAADDWSFYP